ncbi:YoaK family protein [Marisediminicola sp. LYQ85]|uniref:YoaK family protein n=1 Tax=Marisediminicola sp. LYQ85 TaxID=3391062 RepID=UPI003982D967
MLKRLRSNPSGLHLVLMLALTFSTGVIDAVGYLGLDRVFTGNMTGNVVILGMGLVGADDLPIVGPFIALIAFMLGALVAGRTLRPVEAGWTTHSTWLFTIVGAIIAAAAVAAFVVGTGMPQWLEFTITGALGLAMGLQAGAARHIAVKDVTTVVVTSTLVGLAFDSRFGGTAKQQWKRRLGAVLLIGAGAAAGAALLRLDLGWGMALSAAISILVAIVGHLGRPAPAPTPDVEGRASAA